MTPHIGISRKQPADNPLIYCQPLFRQTEPPLTSAATASVSGPLLASLELSIRAEDRNTRGATTLIRPAIGYQVSKKLTLWIGYVRVDTRPQGRSDVAENRYFQQASWNLGTMGPAAISARTRLEQRTVEGARDTGWRLRQQIRVSLPLRKDGPAIVMSSEPFVGLNATDFGAVAGLDQWRNFMGVNVPAARNLSVEVGYLNRYIRRPAARDRIDHIIPVTLALRFRSCDSTLVALMHP